jgi:hypothetical protein
LILKSSTGDCWLITISPSGEIVKTEVLCPN